VPTFDHPDRRHPQRRRSPVSHDTVWQVLKGEGFEERLAGLSAGRPPPPAPAACTPTVKVKTLKQWPAGMEVVRGESGGL
jgi:hypothetical protein